MHGFNQGTELLKSYCSTGDADFILLQEHWLGPDSLFKITEFTQGYSCFSVSSMVSVLESGLLRGRPFGGLAILVKDENRNFCRLSFSNDRLIAVKYNDILIVDVYFPCSSRQNYKDETLELLDQLELLITNSDIKDVIIGGDFNCTLEIESWSSKLICNFMKEHNLKSCNNLSISVTGDEFTYSNEVLGHYSYLDYFIVSDNLSMKVVSLKIGCDDLNLSDHSPVCIELSNIITTSYKSTNIEKPISESCYQNRWDQADVVGYYESTRVGLEPILTDVRCKPKYFGSNLDTIRDCIDSTYNTIISVLNNAAYQHVPRVKANVLKFWWDQELSELKDKAIASNKLWMEAGKPRNGVIFDNRKSDKYKYKCLIKRKQLETRENITNDLHEALMNKDNDGFWKTWKSKFPSKKTTKYSLIDGASDPREIAEKFGNYFSNICTSETSVYDSSKNVCHERLREYIGYVEHKDKDIISVELLEEVFDCINNGKAAGLDRLTIEHIKFAHPIIVTLLKELFNLLLEYGVVPEGFRKGLAIPLPKNDTSGEFGAKLENFRCITISPVISKLFEHCMLRLFSKYLHSNDAQYGFKKKIGCSHAIYSVKQVVDYYVRGGSTVNLCTLDISKAFDKVNLFVLLGKLMDRKSPNCLINVLFDWFSHNVIIVKWLNELSSSFQVNLGIRQGGAMSPVLFAIYVDDVLVKLNSSRLGCTVKGLTVNAFMYADDLILLAASVTDLQRLIDICVDSLTTIQLSVNAKKCFCMRIGKRFRIDCNNVKIDKFPIQWSSEIRYLGVYFISGHVIKFNLDYCKKKFYRCLNSILSKTGTKVIDILLSLTHSYCIPVLLYATESMSLTITEKRRLASPFQRLYFKMFTSFDPQTIAYCQFYTGYLPMDYMIDLRFLKFLTKTANTTNVFLNLLFSLNGNASINNVCAKYQAIKKDISSVKNAMWNFFIHENKLNI
jgi:exonuclease III